MVGAIIVLVLIAFAVTHLVGGATRHRQHRRAGLNPRISYTFGRGWWASVRVPGIGGRYGHRL
jgi:hypothetical protein